MPSPGDEKLKEPGAGWGNLDIELAAARQAQTPTEGLDRGSDFVGGTTADGNKQWLQSLKRRQSSGQCRCGTWTTQTWVYAAEQVEGRNWGLLTVFECGMCRLKREVKKIELALERPDLPDNVRREYERFVRENESAA